MKQKAESRGRLFGQGPVAKQKRRLLAFWGHGPFAPSPKSAYGVISLTTVAIFLVGKRQEKMFYQIM